MLVSDEKKQLTQEEKEQLKQEVIKMLKIVSQNNKDSLI